MSATSNVRVGVILPEVLGTYGDGGNAIVLAKQCQWRGIGCEIVPVGLGDAVPSDLDIYLLGGGEDVAQTLATQHLKRYRGIQEAVEGSAVVLAICAGMQILGEWYTDASGRRVEGVGLLDVRTTSQGSRAIGELVTTPLVSGLTQPLTGFENHGGATQLGSQAQPLGKVLHGMGNATQATYANHTAHVDEGAGEAGDQQFYDGAVQGNIYATYMHGPVLARNPQLVEFLICRATGMDHLDPVELPTVEQLRAERLAAAK